ncbi:hypothetical protein AN218_13015 [Streptomyces nanshensis]|uniref:Uncharacterized protein n=1 Tax=Streptomyces nanshensis TaxID=518642 RepID=A0A1E7L5I7_9ACTN|nr:hypothetical protein AN218_13015 [Streptomyces nanshensis]
MLNPSTERTVSGSPKRPQLVPYITQWSGERAPKSELVIRRGRLAFADERPYDRDSNGVLWSRVPSQPGKGKPEFGKVHALRQRNAMERLLCQVCGKAADRNQDGILWLLGEAPDSSGDSGVLTAHPPLCLPCAHASVSACPHLRREYIALRVSRLERAGVRGALFQPSGSQPVAVDVGGVAFDDPLIRWVRAGQLLVYLTDFRVIDL